MSSLDTIGLQLAINAYDNELIEFGAWNRAFAKAITTYLNFTESTSIQMFDIHEIRRAVATEREECAQLAQDVGQIIGHQIASKIRDRS